ncbi:hypothetical protein AZI86_14000 [Bdellovibrio bacteriovorus]|uniref:Thiamine pyrimidine synthase n=1 Tax=Bdellovibrio bacteriovorus TaxID=959 RepID=A0A150WKA3_BDEBC|nr:hypothetical protein AZI86_14000 [Bdellovibrio bacteriovorus]
MPTFTPVTLALNWKAEPEFGGFYAGQILNHYRDQGLDVKIQEGGSGTPTIQMLASGKLDFAIVSADEIIISQDRNKNNKVIALFATYQKSPYIIMTHAERNFKSLKDVWTSEGILSMQSGLPYYKFLLNKWGKPKAKIVPYLGGVGNFVNDKTFSQQGFISTEPVSAERAGAKTKNFIIADEGFNPYLVILATTEKTLKEKPELVKKLIQGTRNGWQAYLNSPEATNKHMAQINKALDFETFQKGASLQKDLIITTKNEALGSMTKERWEALSQQIFELKLIKNKPNSAESYFR